MRSVMLAMLPTAAALFAAVLYPKPENKDVQRVGMVIGVKPDRLSAYEAVHAASNPGVRDLLAKYHMHNF